MANLVALEMPIGEPLVQAIKSCAQAGEAFCVIDPSTPPRRRAELLSTLKPTVVQDSSGHREPHSGEPVDDGDGAVVITSGSSGSPKAAVLTWDALVASARLTTEALRRDGDQVWLAAIPAVHIGGLAVILRGVLGGARLIFDTSITEGPLRGATHVSLVRTQLQRFETAHFQCVLLGGGAPPKDVAANVTTTWGMTETGSGVIYDGIALPGVDLAVLDGELLVQSPTLLRTYRDRSRPSVSHQGRDDWFPTGDAASIDDGVVTIHGRLEYVINSGGEKIWPEDLENLFVDIPGLQDVAVVGRPDQEWGQVATVLAVTNRDAAAVLDQCRAIAREHLGRWAQPKAIEIVSSIPRTPNGKVVRSGL